MKRSEMIQLGIDRLHKIHKNPIPQTDLKEEDYHFIVNTLLDCFQKNGMRPPFSENIFALSLINRCQWEPEDETK